jgi:hypothetical protein
MLIRRGDKGEKVKKVQRALQRFGFDSKDDGDFGPGTESAVKEFQRRNNLDVDGLVGKGTLIALGLDPNTLEAISGGTAGDGTKIEFKEEDVTVPEVVQQRIREYVDVVVDRRSKILGSCMNALANFETTMSFASAKEARPEILGAMLSKAYALAVDELISEVPGLSTVKSFFDAATEELERAGKASASLSVGTWIKDQRAAIDDLIQRINRDKLQFAVEEAYLDRGEDDRQLFFGQFIDTISRLQQTGLPNIDVLEQQLYEQWINAHFRSIGEEAPGCIEYRWEFNADENVFDFVSCTVEAPFGDKAGTALNRLLERGQLAGVKHPLDFRVRKRVCLRVASLVPGGRSWDCGWLDMDNHVLHRPILPNAEKGFQDPVWRGAVKRFKRAD